MGFVRCTIHPCILLPLSMLLWVTACIVRHHFILNFFPLSMSLWFSGGFLQKKVLVEGENFFFLPVVVWKVFTSWYGVAGLQGGPALPRLVRSSASALSFLQSLPPSLPLYLLLFRPLPPLYLTPPSPPPPTLPPSLSPSLSTSLPPSSLLCT